MCFGKLLTAHCDKFNYNEENAHNCILNESINQSSGICCQDPKKEKMKQQTFHTSPIPADVLLQVEETLYKPPKLSEVLDFHFPKNKNVSVCRLSNLVSWPFFQLYVRVL